MIDGSALAGAVLLAGGLAGIALLVLQRLRRRDAGQAAADDVPDAVSTPAAPFEAPEATLPVLSATELLQHTDAISAVTRARAVAGLNEGTWNRHLAPVIDRVAELIGDDAAPRLFEKLGGDRIYIHKRPSDGSESYQRLVDAIGPEHAEILRQWCAGTPLDIPRELAVRRLVRNIKIIRDYGNGTPVRALCREYALSRRQIFEILKKPIDIEPETSV